MGLSSEFESYLTMSGRSWVGPVALLAFVGLSAVAVLIGDSLTNAWKLLGISWAAFAAMALAVPLGSRARQDKPWFLVWGYGLASGAMIVSAAVFLVPQAIAHHPQFGGFGIGLGLLIGFGAHTIGHRLTHLDLPLDRTVAELSAHAFAAGATIGVIYGNMPELGPTLGLAIVSHKGPAGYAAASRLRGAKRDASVMLLPAAGLGIAAIAASILQLPTDAAIRGIVFGFAAGVFLHVAMDFLPHCELGSDIHELMSTEGEAHHVLDRLRMHAVASTALGGLVVFLAWLLVA